MELMNVLKSNCWKSELHYIACRAIYELWLLKNYRRFTMEDVVRRKFKKAFGRELDVKNPQTLNEKLQWIKLYEHHDYDSICADKYAMKQWVADLLGTDKYNVPVLYHTSNWRDISAKTITQFPCIIKPNHTSHDYMILRSAADVNWRQLRRRCRFWLHRKYHIESQEVQYKDIHPLLLVEPLLETKAGKIPHDYKLNFMNGRLEFVYVSYDREGIDVRCVFDEKWNVLPFYWGGAKQPKYIPCPVEIPEPVSYKKMKEIGEKIARYFKYVRVDFYDVDGVLYIGEITLHHGGGCDCFRPEEYDKLYGEKLDLNA